MPNDVLDLNLGQVQAAIEGYSERVVDATIQSVWTGYYASYYFGKHPKNPTDVIKQIIANNSKGDTSRRDTQHSTDMQTEIELFAQRDLKFLHMTGGNSDGK